MCVVIYILLILYALVNHEESLDALIFKVSLVETFNLD